MHWQPRTRGSFWKAECWETGMLRLERGKGRKALPIATEAHTRMIHRSEAMGRGGAGQGSDRLPLAGARESRSGLTAPGVEPPRAHAAATPCRLLGTTLFVTPRFRA